MEDRSYIIASWDHEKDCVNVDIEIKHHPKHNIWRMMYNMLACAVMDTAKHRVKAFEEVEEAINIAQEILVVLTEVHGYALSKLLQDNISELGEKNRDRAENLMKDAGRRANLQLVETNDEENRS